MSNMVMAILMAMIAGIAVTIQAPLASILNQRIGQLESVFIVHLGGTVVAGIILLFIAGGNMRAWRNAPWYTYLAGLLGLAVIASLNIAILRMGSAATTVVLVTVNMALGAVMDHFGWLGLEVRPLTLPRIAGMLVMGMGAWLIVR
ncbi:MAG: DMT family transporter [Anaerolineaceae bacterium]|nr:DMT family transporter [Anaerolineaceae bacterium]